MTNFYRITPLEKKSVEYFVDVYENMPDDTIRGFDVTERWRWGQGFREEDDQPFECELDRVICDPQTGWGCELEDLCGVHVNFGAGYTDEEKAEIEALLCYKKEDEDGLCGTGWIYNGDHNLEIEDATVTLHGPVRIDLVDDCGNVIQENVGAIKGDTLEGQNN